MRIVIDCQCFQVGSRYRGIGHYATALIRQMLVENKEQNNSQNEIIFILNNIDILVVDKIKNDFAELLNNVKIYTINIFLDCIDAEKKYQ